MASDWYAAIVKFFRSEKYLEQLLDGKLYCNTPEYYRLNDERGISDRNESCTASYRSVRGDPKLTLRINGKPISANRVPSATVRLTGMRDHWLHCWTSLHVPEDGEDASSMIQDILRLRRDFGVHYACISADRVDAFAEHVKKLTSLDVRCQHVRYSNVSRDWSPACKSQEYAYQREFRFLIGPCPDESLEPLVLVHEDGFRDLVQRDVNIRIRADGLILFEMSGPEEQVDRNHVPPGSS